jgi:outer membrane murein-binding lipoprotein Lpp
MANAGERANQKNVVAAASSVVSSLNAKILSMQKEMEIIKTTLQRERIEHQQEKDQLDEILKKKKLS